MLRSAWCLLPCVLHCLGRAPMHPRTLIGTARVWLSQLGYTCLLSIFVGRSGSMCCATTQPQGTHGALGQRR